MASSICPWPFLSPLKTAAPKVLEKTFAQALAVGGMFKQYLFLLGSSLEIMFESGSHNQSMK